MSELQSVSHKMVPTGLSPRTQETNWSASLQCRQTCGLMCSAQKVYLCKFTVGDTCGVTLSNVCVNRSGSRYEYVACKVEGSSVEELGRRSNVLLRKCRLLFFSTLNTGLCFTCSQTGDPQTTSTVSRPSCDDMPYYSYDVDV